MMQSDKYTPSKYKLPDTIRLYQQKICLEIYNFLHEV